MDPSTESELVNSVNAGFPKQIILQYKTSDVNENVDIYFKVYCESDVSLNIIFTNGLTINLIVSQPS